MQVGPDGALYVAIGGRRTRGSVFRIGPANAPRVNKPPDDAVSKVLSAPQPLTSWSRAVWEPAARNAGAAAFVTAARDGKRNVEERMRAIEASVALFEGIVGDNAIALANDKEPRVRARVAWAIGRTMAARKLADEPGFRMLSTLAQDKSPLVRQRALTAFDDLPRDPKTLVSAAIVEAVFANLGHVERRVASAAAATAVSLDESAWRKLRALAAAAPLASKLGFHLTSALRARRYGTTPEGLVNEALTLWPQARTPDQALAVVRRRG